MCPQAAPIWSQDIQPTFVIDYLYDLPFNMSTNISSYPYIPTAQDSSVSEDCLFLDVIVPKKVFDRTRAGNNTPKKLAPVLVWIFGGGYVRGDKQTNDARGLVQRSTVAGHEGVVYVTLNYRVSKRIDLCFC
jgi:carboxylesterase type B